jgi:WD40 repeat protein
MAFLKWTRAIILGRSIFDLVLTPDQDHVVAGGADGALRLWNLPEQRLVSTLTGHDSAVRMRRPLIGVAVMRDRVDGHGSCSCSGPPASALCTPPYHIPPPAPPPTHASPQRRTLTIQLLVLTAPLLRQVNALVVLTDNKVVYLVSGGKDARILIWGLGSPPFPEDAGVCMSDLASGDGTSVLALAAAKDSGTLVYATMQVTGWPVL